MSNTAVVESVWTAIESGDFDAFETLMHPDGIDFRGNGAQATTGREMREFVEAYKAGFPDLSHEVVDAVESGDTVAVELKVTGTHTGPLRGPGGEIPPTGRPVVWETVDFVKVRDGKVTSWHVYDDQLAFFVQLGLMPDPTAQPA
jgi:ketosteroid isomerase-like protein